MKKKYLYGIIIILVLCISGFISIPFLENLGTCEVGDKTGRMYFRFLGISMPIEFNKCDRG